MGKTLLIITPGTDRNYTSRFNLIVAETGEHLYSHIYQTIQDKS